MRWSEPALRQVLEAVQVNGEVLAHAAQELRADEEVVLAAVKTSGKALSAASAELRASKEVVLEAVRQNPWALLAAPPELRQDRKCRQGWKEGERARLPSTTQI